MDTKDIATYFEMPLLELLFAAQATHQKHFKPNAMQLASLLNIKTGTCPENCSYCPQSAHYRTGVTPEKLWPLENILESARAAQKNGATRFCIAGAWRSPPDKVMPELVEALVAIKAMGLETCATFGMLSQAQADKLKEAELDYYNHNIDCAPEFYPNIITTHQFEDRIQTLTFIRKAGIKVCCGGILGLGESRENRIEFLRQLTLMPEPPLSVPINLLIPIEGTPLEQQVVIDELEFVRTIAVARIVLPTSVIRLSGNRKTMSKSWQTLCFVAGANSVFIGEKLLATPNNPVKEDLEMLKTLGIQCMQDVRQVSTI